MAPLDYKRKMALQDVDVAFLKDNFLTGFTFYGADGRPLPDAFFEGHLRRAVGVLEDTVNIDIVERVNVDEKHDYRIGDYNAFAFLQLFRFPARSVQRVQAVYPTGQSIQVYPSEWVKLEEAHSQIQLVPTAGTISQVLIGQGGSYLPLVYSTLGWLPQLWHIDYTSGFDPNDIPQLIVETIAKIAAYNILTIMSDLVHPIGVVSQALSVDGLSQSRGFLSPAFRARLEAYRGDLWGQPGLGGGLIAQIRSTYLPIVMVAL